MSRRVDPYILLLICTSLTMVCLALSFSYAQKITHVDFTVDGSKVEITYDIIACPANEVYDIRLMLGQDGNVSEIKRGLTGDLEHVACGTSNMIVWDVLSDRQELNGPVNFTVEILNTHTVAIQETPMVTSQDDVKQENAGGYQNEVSSAGVPGPESRYRSRQSAYVVPLRIFQIASLIAFEHARAAILSHGRPTVVFQKHPGPVSPQRKRRP